MTFHHLFYKLYCQPYKFHHLLQLLKDNLALYSYSHILELFLLLTFHL